MAEQVERKKSYRWVSAGQATYDGADWDSSDESMDENGIAKGDVPRRDTISRLPALPKLQYDEEVGDEKGADQEIVKNVEETERETAPERVSPQYLVAEEAEEDVSAWETPRLAKVSSRNSSKSSLPVRRTPVNDDLENLMAQISKEMTPKIDQTNFSDNDDFSPDSDRISGNSLEKRPLSAADSDADLEVSKSGYFAKYVNDEEDKDYKTIDNSPSSSAAAEERLLRDPAKELTEHHDSKDKSEAVENKIVSPQMNETESVSSALKVEQQKTPRSSFDYNYSSDDGDDQDDALSYTDSIKYQGKKVDKRDEAEVGNTSASLYDAPEEILANEDVGSSDESDQVPKSGYFNRMVHGDSDSSDEETHEDERTIPETIETTDIPEDKKWKNSGGAEVVNDSQTTVERDNDEKEEVANHQQQQEDNQNNVAEDGAQGLASRQSINLGKWKPDTEAFRTGFVQETSNNPPPGYVYDETGKLVDLTPSSMKNRVVSTYSEVESSWNAFPSEGKDDLETIRDTKTIYDNNTIHNVPGILTNNQNLPPLPDIAHRVLSNDSSDDPKSFGTGNSTYTTLDGEAHRGPGQTHFKEVFTVPEPKADEIAKVTGQTKVPYLDVNKVLNDKGSHVNKLRQLREYSNQLSEYDGGIQTWLNYTLKSSSKTDRDLIFDEYKVSKHVRDAYANADELNRKHIVSNTVANVNQNVSHLTRRVFAHSKKSRGLFSSIARKKVSI